MKKDRIVFFASGDFAIDTFEMLVKNGSNIVGLVTSNDNVKFHKYTIKEVAERLRIPYYIVKNDKMEEDMFLIDWLKRLNADIYCVISFKKLPKEIIKLAKKCAFNVHASLLPCLRGAAPINWAIRLGYKETGLTAFVLNDRIDCGDIIANTKVKIAPEEKYTTLYKKLSDLCVDFTDFVVNDALQRENWQDCLVVQPTWSETREYLAEARKINSEYFNIHLETFEAENFKHIVDSVDDIGFNAILCVDDKEEIPIKIYDVELCDDDDELIFFFGQVETDRKTYFKIYLPSQKCVLVKKIQIVGKKILNIKDFLNGFKYIKDENKEVTLQVRGNMK